MLFDTITFVKGADHNYDLSGSTLDTPTDGSTIMRMSATRDFLLPQNLVGSVVDAQTGPSATTGSPPSGLLVKVQVNGVSQGTFSFNGDGSPLTAISQDMSTADYIRGNLASGNVSVSTGDIVEIVLELTNSSDNISVTLKTLAA